MTDWIGGLLAGFGDAVSSIIGSLGDQLANSIFTAVMQWWYRLIFNAAADFFTLMTGMGTQVFDLPWVSAVVQLFSNLGWMLFAVGTAVSAFDLAIEYQHGKGSVQDTALNVLKGFMAAGMISTVPVELYRFCVTLQHGFAGKLAAMAAGSQVIDLPEQSNAILQRLFVQQEGAEITLMALVSLIAFAYCIVKVFIQNISRGGIMLVQIAVGSLYLFSLPRGYADGFMQWTKQIVALCLTAFLQTTMLYLGMLSMPDNLLLGLGIMLAANEVPRVAERFGLESSVKVNLAGAIHTTSTAVSLIRTAAAAV